MLCEICKKNPATIHIQELVAGSKKALHICVECAEKKTNLPLQFDGNFDFTEMLYNLTEQLGLMGVFGDNDESELIEDEQDDSEAEKISCTNCGWTLAKLRKTGRMGCQQCYSAFRDSMQDDLTVMHRGTVHVGKSPGGTISEATAVMFEIMSLKQELQHLIRREEYEKAAEIRDRINSLSLENFAHQVTIEN